MRLNKLLQLIRMQGSITERIITGTVIVIGFVLGIVGYYFLSITIFKSKEINARQFSPNQIDAMQFSPTQFSTNDDLANIIMRFIPN